MSTLLKLGMKARWGLIEQWLSEYRDNLWWDCALPSRSTHDAASRRGFSYEAARADRVHRCSLFVDLSTFYEGVDHLRLCESASRAGFPDLLLHLAVEAYRGGSIVVSDEVASSTAYARKGIIAGCPLAPTLSKLAVGESIRQTCIGPDIDYVGTWIDDISVDTENKQAERALTADGHQVSIGKTYFLASSATAEKDLGMELTGGRRRCTNLSAARRVTTGSVEVALEMGAPLVKDPLVSIVTQHFKALARVMVSFRDRDQLSRTWAQLTRQLQRADRWKVVCGPFRWLFPRSLCPATMAEAEAEGHVVALNGAFPVGAVAACLSKACEHKRWEALCRQTGCSSLTQGIDTTVPRLLRSRTSALRTVWQGAMKSRKVRQGRSCPLCLKPLTPHHMAMECKWWRGRGARPGWYDAQGKERLARLTWTRSHSTAQQHAAEFGTHSSWRGEINAAADTACGEAAKEALAALPPWNAEEADDLTRDVSQYLQRKAEVLLTSSERRPPWEEEDEAPPSKKKVIASTAVSKRQPNQNRPAAKDLVLRTLGPAALQPQGRLPRKLLGTTSQAPAAVVQAPVTRSRRQGWGPPPALPEGQEMSAWSRRQVRKTTAVKTRVKPPDGDTDASNGEEEGEVTSPAEASREAPPQVGADPPPVPPPGTGDSIRRFDISCRDGASRACQLRSKMSSLNFIREHDGVVLDLEDTVREQLADGVRRLVAEAVPGKPLASTSPSKDEEPKEEEGAASQPPPAEPQVPCSSEAAGEQASASSAGPTEGPARAEAVKKEDEGTRKPLLSDDCRTCYACNISVPYKEMMSQHMMSDWHIHNVAVFYGLKPP
ncbi:hypothetical protein AK812_SmicGene43458 [Symbiodinium microadriaticum]|uniref:S1-like domain-containing protein n=1 Tax=Symbiodinium microadriaticum TaxID=2951 RepID=A0A1Q9C0Z8_SYMMI|nr:hypothetical protein AK812_SmicGene43458 [Symbiodinium microadriaticum]CAE7617054.1 unnamed protein product [Symbiodinium sp. KB8]